MNQAKNGLFLNSCCKFETYESVTNFTHRNSKAAVCPMARGQTALAYSNTRAVSGSVLFCIIMKKLKMYSVLRLFLNDLVEGI